MCCRFLSQKREVSAGLVYPIRSPNPCWTLNLSQMPVFITIRKYDAFMKASLLRNKSKFITRRRNVNTKESQAALPNLATFLVDLKKAHLKNAKNIIFALCLNFVFPLFQFSYASIIPPTKSKPGSVQVRGQFLETDGIV